LTGVSSKANSSISFASGSLAMVIWYLIERALAIVLEPMANNGSLSLISACNRSPTIFCGSC